MFHEKAATNVVFYETEAVLALSKTQGISGNPSMGNFFLKNINFATKVKEKMWAMIVFLLQTCAIQLWKFLIYWLLQDQTWPFANIAHASEEEVKEVKKQLCCSSNS